MIYSHSYSSHSYSNRTPLLREKTVSLLEFLTMILVKPALSHADRGYQGGSHSCKQCLITPCIRLGSSNGQTLFSPNYPSNQNGIRHCTSSITCKVAHSPCWAHLNACVVFHRSSEPDVCLCLPHLLQPLEAKHCFSLLRLITSFIGKMTRVRHRSHLKVAP
jgi:hypothetical protein